ncbi:MAG TPA: tRNA pseudouridine(13) synthase TruD [Methanolinea sp.]|nr:MAG: putative tRNA pseudouridine synthase D [Methanoregulaceae archaeon PtaB.Bin009]OPY41855.1 MAG: putative tRNA pseudouridine synthase D [Methanoregulaceae archaeon PtaU1.Bin066]HII76112.1 tRNA pseudouridine(13) synthase TruD [Methanolinea sp.]
MRETPYPLEQSLGMRWYASNTPGIGGRLRTTAEDFVVEETSSGPGDEGPYLICRLTKKDWELQRAVREIAHALSISHRRIGWTGTKDKHAVTTQLISIYGVSEDDLGRIRLKDLEVLPVGRSREPLLLGAHDSNHFTITIRDTTSPDLGSEVAEVAAACGRGIPNYFGIQRFGVIRPITHLVGEHILKGDFDLAVDCYVGMACPGEPPAVREAREAYAEEKDTLAALRSLPVPLTYERAMLHHLVSHPGDFRGALLSLPPKLLSMFVSAFQSYLFNMALSARMERDPDFSLPAPGDRLIFSNGREDTVTVANRDAAMMQVARGRCKVAIMMPGSRAVRETGEDDRAVAALLSMHDIVPDSFSRASSFVKARYDGALRPVPLTAEVMSTVTGPDVTLSFSLAPGQYATTVCREFMKADPRAMV